MDKNFSKKRNNKSQEYTKGKNEKSNKNYVRSQNSLNINNIIPKKKFFILLLIIFGLMLFLAGRLFYLQIIDGSYLSGLATNKQVKREEISSTRGNIYDSTGTPLAITEPVDTISINPTKIVKKTDEETKVLKENLAKAFSDIFGLDYDTMYQKVTSTASTEVIAKKVEEDKVNELKTWMSDNNVTIGINIDEDSKRYYPYSTLASQVIGVCGNDNQGLSGIEYSYDSILTGTSGEIITSTDASQSEIPDSEQSFIPAENGYNLTLSIDVNIQSIVEKYLKQGVEDNKCSKGGNCIIMNPSTGDILAMASYPNYDLNDPFTPTSYYADGWDSLSSTDKSSRLMEMWKVRSVSEMYEPGSVFKLITSSVALEENITKTDVANDFYCSSIEDVNGTQIKCWKYPQAHGSETLRQALMNSCNPAFIQLGKRIGASTLYKYYDAFGFFNKTGIGLSGEASGYFYDLSKVGTVELATMSFGQRFTITPLQMCTAISAIANNGYLLQPRLVTSMTNTDTNETTSFETKTVRQVISSETASKVKSMMESVVTDGTGKNAQVAGYSIGGKSGTSEPNSSNPDAGYVTSFAAISPIEDTKVVILVTLYDPQGSSHQGGQTAAPIVSKILSEVLPYLGIEQTN